MSGLAVVMAEMGYAVSGCDCQPGSAAESLKAFRIEVHAGHDASHVAEADVVVYTTALPKEHEELSAARERGIPVLTRAEMLGRLMAEKYGIAVAGTHGKTTTTSMLAKVLEDGGLNPTILVGADPGRLSENAKYGDSNILVTEACEAFKSFHELWPDVTIITNIEPDHLDEYGSFDAVIESFRKFLSQVKDTGLAVMCADCPTARSVVPSVKARVITYGMGDADCRACNMELGTPQPAFDVVLKGKNLGRFQLRVGGEHNVRNALAVIAVATELGVRVDKIKGALNEFAGASRRFEVLGTENGITIVDDYAHHPTEIAVTLKAARAWGRRIVAVFQPHMYSRTQLFADSFADSLKLADEVIVTDVYPAREAPIPGVSGDMIVTRINTDGVSKARFVADKQQVAGELAHIVKPGDMVIVMGAGDIRAAGEAFLALLRS